VLVVFTSECSHGNRNRVWQRQQGVLRVPCNLSMSKKAVVLRCCLHHALALSQGAGAVPMAKLLGMLTSLINSSTPTSVGTHADTVFRFLLPALDVRQTHCGKLSEAGECAAP
jgi:hypothetical protein